MLSDPTASLRTHGLQVTAQRLAVLRAVDSCPHITANGVADNHHHLVCRSCDRVVDVDCAVGEAPCLTPDDEHGFALDEAEVVYWGLCGDCRHVAS